MNLYTPLPESTCVRDFIYRDTNPTIERKMRALLKPCFRNEDEYKAREDDVEQFLIQHLLTFDRQPVIQKTEQGENIRSRKVTPKIEELKELLFPLNSEIEEEATVKMSRFMEMKRDYELMLLEARDEIIRLNSIVLSGNSSQVMEGEAKVESKESTEDETKDEENIEGNYLEVNALLNELAMLREVKRKYGRIDEIEETSNRSEDEVELVEDIVVRPPDPVIKECLIVDLTCEMDDRPEDIIISCPICFVDLNTDRNAEEYTGCCVGDFCGHALCENCWKQYRRRGNKNCPVCRTLLFTGPGRRPKGNVW